MLYSVADFSTLSIVETINSTYEIAGDAADPLKRNLIEVIINIDKIAVNLEINGSKALIGILLVCSCNICVDLFLRKLSVLYIYGYHFSLPLS